MARRRHRRNHNFDIHVDRSCLSEAAADETPHTMGPEDVVVPEESHMIDDHTKSLLEGEEESLTADTGHTKQQPSVETVADEPENDGAQHDESRIQEDSDADHSVLASRRESDESNDEDGIKRWPSLRTEALIHAAARDIVDHVASRPRDSGPSITGPADEADEADESSFVAAESYTGSPRESFGSEAASSTDLDAEQHSAADRDDDAGGDSSSHHAHEDDVFSDNNSPRSSVGSASESDQHKTSSSNPWSARVSDIPDQDEEFVPTIRGTPRPPFRSPSSVQALQMVSPPASVIGSSYSSRRAPRRSMSRLGSNNISAVYPPKKTPPRFRRNTPPLVLLHVTVMPSRWPWAHVLQNTHPSDLSPGAKALWDAWMQLQYRTGDTVSARGILLPHPQNDYEVLEERLLEALELPLKRRARILECGHYIGPSNDLVAGMEAVSDDEESEDDDGSCEDVDKVSRRQSLADTTHWCKTCRSDIRYESSLGKGKVFRVKVYASNGLMRAGAWQACWKEMERVDVELEPVVDAMVQEELVHLAAEQQRILDMEEEAAADAAAAAVDEEIQLREEAEQALASEQTDVPQEEPDMATESCSVFEDDGENPEEERLREIYGHHSPEPHDEICPPGPPSPPQQADFTQQEAPPLPSARTFEHRQERCEKPRGPQDGASLPELFLEALKVFMQDQKNVMIGLLSFLVLILAVRSGSSRDHRVLSENMVVSEPIVQASVETVTQHTETRSQTRASVEKPVDTVWTSTAATHQASMFAPADTCVVCSKALEMAEMSLRDVPTTTVELVETVTRGALTTVTEELVSTVTETMFQTVTVAAVPTQGGVVEESFEEKQSVSVERISEMYAQDGSLDAGVDMTLDNVEEL
ncbi:hypothetical protein E4U17_001833 [Claviceps sp. LM77 group G4]|nr:hypothetical protein E4U17_001833 [Claviceps sp. LM77 group G4]KAG6065598.1 hypothetical protein E4U33_005827 [Claviceps sp. LM78 group G4]KAG6071734.1 hypothetical protein E4U16_005925 [Claviceps sp. LM84 group G4]